MAPPPPDWPALYRAGATIREIATPAGASWYAVRKVLVDGGIPLRVGGRGRGMWHAEARAMHAQGQSLAGIGRYFGVSYQAVGNAVRRVIS